MVVVSIALATICFTATPGGTEECHPVLIGADTPRGEYTLIRRMTDDPGYGGDVLQFKETDTAVYAIHRVYLLNPKEKRDVRLRSTNVKDRHITKGCINVDPSVFQRLVDCCSRNTPLQIK